MANRQETTVTNGRPTGLSSIVLLLFHCCFSLDVPSQNGYQNKKPTPTAVTPPPPPPGMRPVSTTAFPSQKVVQPPPSMPPIDQMKNLSVLSQPISSTSGLNEYEVPDTSTQSFKKPASQIASFPPRQASSVFSNESSINNSYSSSTVLNEALKKDNRGVPSKSGINGQNGISLPQQRDTPVSTFSNDGSIRFANTSGVRTSVASSSM